MNVSVSGQTMEFIYSALLGVSLAAVYDVFRLVRVYLKAGKLVTGVMDVIFWLLSMAGLMGFVLTVCDGQMRWYILVGAFCGGFVYICTVSHLFFCSLNIIIKVCIHSLRFIAKPLYFFSGKALGMARKMRISAKKRAENRRAMRRERKKPQDGLE